MNIKIKIKKINPNITLPFILDKGEWIDLRASQTVTLKGPQAGTLKRKECNGENISFRDVTFDVSKIPLGVAMKLPKGFEAMVLPRSGTFNTFGIILANSEGVIDNSYSGNEDEWKFQAIAFNHTTIDAGDRICQFRIQLSQKATMWQKIKWLFSSKIELIEVDNLDDNNRGGFSSTGVK